MASRRSPRDGVRASPPPPVEVLVEDECLSEADQSLGENRGEFYRLSDRTVSVESSNTPRRGMSFRPARTRFFRREQFDEFPRRRR